MKVQHILKFGILFLPLCLPAFVGRLYAQNTDLRKIEASVSMGGIVRYRGDPEEVSTSTSLGGTISHKRTD
jgi:hypothetical protein